MPLHRGTSRPTEDDIGLEMPGRLGMMLGRLLERSEQIPEMFASQHRQMDRIERRLEKGDARMDAMTAATQANAKAIEELKSRQDKAEIGATERWTKDVARIAVPLLVLWLTGSIDAAMKIAGGLK